MLCAFAPKQTAVFRLMIFATFGISEAVAGYIWIGIFRPGESGLLNGMLIAVGLGDWTQAWLGSAYSALGALIIAASWSAVGLPLLLSFAAVQTIPRTVLEAAQMRVQQPVHLGRPVPVP